MTRLSTHQIRGVKPYTKEFQNNADHVEIR